MEYRHDPTDVRRRLRPHGRARARCVRGQRGLDDVIAQLLGEGVPAVAVSNPLRGIAHDAAYVASALGQIPGSVLAVGHSYGGAVLTNARCVQATFSDWS